ncbi:MAG: response regulator [Magnetococcales bacterium]|nr:response regulator [Magnetococcales bacterium]NGZ25976.1 response regulator [Magnetococcales bacterium]
MNQVDQTLHKPDKPMLLRIGLWLLIPVLIAVLIFVLQNRHQRHLWQPIVELHQPSLMMCNSLQPLQSRLIYLITSRLEHYPQETTDAFTITLLANLAELEEKWQTLLGLQPKASASHHMAQQALQQLGVLRGAINEGSQPDGSRPSLLEPLLKMVLLLGHVERLHSQAVEEGLRSEATTPSGLSWTLLLLVIWLVGSWYLLKRLLGIWQGSVEHIQQMEERARQAGTANHAKSLFLANMSHEFRPPLNSILGMVEMLQEAALSREHLHYLGITHAATENLLALVNTITDLSRLETGKISLEERVLELRGVVNSVCQMMSMRLKGKPVVAKCHLADNLPAHLLGDGNRLSQILFHLAANGIKFTEKGRITLSVSHAATQPQSLAKNPPQEGEEVIWLSFKFSDTGGGMDGEHLSRLHASLQQTRPWNSEMGSGVGLFICHNLVRRMGGSLTVTSEAGTGTTVEVLLPFHLKPEGDNPFGRLHVLVVHGDQRQRFQLRELLQGLGCKNVVLAENGQQGLNHFRHACNIGTSPGMVILECGLSDMEWMRVAGEVRLLVPTVPLVLIPHGQCSQDVLRQSALKINATLPPPITSETLAETLKYALQQDSIFLHPPQPLSRERGSAERPWRILTVDDSEDSILLMHAYLRGQPFRVDSAVSGMAALEKVRFNRYDLIFMDLQMPEMDGLETTRRLRQLEEERQEGKIPIIALTAHPQGMNEENALTAGCDLYLTKPIRKQELLETIQKLLASHIPP